MIDKEWQLNNMRLVDANELRKHAVTVYQGNGVELEPIEVVPLAEIDNAETYNQVGHKMATAEGFITNPEWKKGDLISRDALKDEMSKVFFNDNDDMRRIEELIDNASTVDTDEIYKKGYHNGFFATHGEPERPQGKWVIQRLQNSFDDVYCPFCNARPTRSEYGYYLKDNFCHECGADMRGSVK